MQGVSPAALSLIRRVAADLIALAVGAGWTWFGAKVLPEIVPALSLNTLAGVVVLLVVWVLSGPIAAQLREALLRRWGAALPPARTPRNFRAVLCWAGGVLATCAPFALVWVIARALGEEWAAAMSLAGQFAIYTAPTVGVLATRALCRHWAAPPSSSSPPVAAPAPAPAPLPARPADDPPAGQFHPALA